MTEPEAVEINYDPIPTLEMFHKSKATYRCIVGPVGSGKTTAASIELFCYIPAWLYEQYGIKKTRWVILRNTYRELADTTQKTVFEWIPWGTYRAGEGNFKVKYKDGVEIEAMFRSCDRPEDIKKFKSLEITGYWIDESIEVKEEVKLMLKNRIGRFPRRSPVRFGIETTNPPDVEHPTYYHFDWQTPVPGPEPERTESWQRTKENHHGFWQPPNENNANLPPNYYVNLIKDYQGNSDWIERYVHGKPGITVTGKAVYWNFRRDLHVAQEPLIWSTGKLFAGWDNTGNCPACVILQMPTAGQLQVLAEYHSERMGIVDFVEMVVADRNMRWPAAEWTEYGDPAGEAKFSKKGGGLTSNADLMRDAGITLQRSDQNWEARRESVETQMGKLVRGEPAFLVDPGCVRLINGLIGGYCYPELGTSGIYSDKPLKNKYSHVHDALQYVMVMLNRNVPTHDRKKRKFTGFSNWPDRNLKKDKSEYWEAYA